MPTNEWISDSYLGLARLPLHGVCVVKIITGIIITGLKADCRRRKIYRLLVRR
jgi:hypothetical protein